MAVCDALPEARGARRGDGVAAAAARVVRVAARLFLVAAGKRHPAAAAPRAGKTAGLRLARPDDADDGRAAAQAKACLRDAQGRLKDLHVHDWTLRNEPVCPRGRRGQTTREWSPHTRDDEAMCSGCRHWPTNVTRPLNGCDGRRPSHGPPHWRLFLTRRKPCCSPRNSAAQASGVTIGDRVARVGGDPW